MNRGTGANALSTGVIGWYEAEKVLPASCGRPAILIVTSSLPGIITESLLSRMPSPSQQMGVWVRSTDRLGDRKS